MNSIDSTFSTIADTSPSADASSRDASLPLAELWADARRPEPDDSGNLGIALIDDRPLISDCFGRGLAAIDPTLELQYYSDLNSFENADQRDVERIQLILICIGWTPSRSDEYFARIARLRASKPSADIVVLSDVTEMDYIMKAVEHGVRGYIPTTVSLEVAVRAMQLVAAGGVYIPASVLFRITKQIAQPSKHEGNDRIFTSRQMAVIEALRRGKANKIIAYDLNMCESTVKVHVRNIMKRLKARNRTEAAYILNEMMHQRDEMARN